MSASLSGLHVWITRPNPEAETSTQAWLASGAQATTVPLLQVVQLELDADLITSIRSRPPDAIAFTSGRSCEYLLSALRPHADLLPALRTVPAWCVGPATAAAAQAAGFHADVVADGRGAAELGAQMAQRLPPESLVLFPCSAKRRPELPRALAKASIQWTEWPVYDVVSVGITQPWHRRELEEHDPLLLLYSPSAAIAAARAVRRLGRRGIRVAAIGKTTAAAAREWELEVVAVADKPSESAFLSAVSDWWEREQP